jgi:hypothetical protein
MINKTDNPILIGAIAPITNPGWIEAGHHLLRNSLTFQGFHKMASRHS